MESFNYDSYCGIYCGACDIMLAYTTGNKSALACFWDEATVKAFQDHQGIPYDATKPFTFKCNGCKTDTLFVNCAACHVRKCAIASEIEHCIDCISYPCTFILEANKGKSFLPHLRRNYSNMERIHNVGITQWLTEQENRWKCPNCKTSFSWYARKCSNCGKDLKEYSYRFSFLQSIILKLVFSIH